MTTRYRYALGAALLIPVLFWMSGAPLERGWAFMGWGVATIVMAAVGFVVGYSIEQHGKGDSRHEE